MVHWLVSSTINPSGQMAERYKTYEKIIMEPTLIATFAFLIFLCIVVAIDEMLERKQDLGEEWDFVTHYSRRKSCLDK